MDNSLPDSWFQELLSRADIVSIIGEYTTLTPKGGKLWGCCPFHNEKTPSFKVDSTTQLYYCFGCHKGGNVITFLKEKENMSGFEAVRYLAERVGLAMPNVNYDKAAADKRNNELQRLYNANRDAARYYHSMLHSNLSALSYFRDKRGFSDETITKFGLGYAPDSWTSLCDYLIEKGYTEEELVNAGLAKRSEKGRVFDFFRNRVMFPIIDEKSRVLGFGGRTMGNDKPKYINTGDTAIYNKRNNLFALNMLKKGTLNDIILTEGYIDVIALNTAGIENAVASLGTALTENQARLLKRRTNIVYICYDGDSAGQEANLRGLDILQGANLEVRVIKLPEGLDPDEFVSQYGDKGMEHFLALKGESLSLNSFKIAHMASKYNLDVADHRQALAVEACKLLSTLQPVERERYISEVSSLTGISKDALARQSALSQPKQPVTYQREQSPAKSNYLPSKERSTATNEREKIEFCIAAYCSKSRAAALLVVESALELISDSVIRDFIVAASKNDKINTAAYLATINQGTEGLVKALAEPLPDYEDESQLVVVVRDCVRRLKIKDCEEKLLKLPRLLSAKEITTEEYSIRHKELQRLLKELKQG